MKAERPGYSPGGWRTCRQVVRVCGVLAAGHMRSMWTTGKKKRTRGWGNHGSGSGSRSVGLWGGGTAAEKVKVFCGGRGVIASTPELYTAGKGRVEFFLCEFSVNRGSVGFSAARLGYGRFT